MKLLVLSSRSPWPVVRADQLTIERLLRHLAARGDSVDLVTFVESAAEESALRAEFASVCRRIVTLPRPAWQALASTAMALPTSTPMQVSYFRSRAMDEQVRQLVGDGDYDLVYAHAIRMAEYARHLEVPTVLGAQLSQALNLQRMADHVPNPFRRWFFRREERRVRPYEAQVAADFNRVILVGRRDVEELAKSAAVPNAVVCPHGQDFPPLDRVLASQRESGAIVFSGVMATYTNVDAASWFANEVFPQVREKVPHASFWIVGRRPHRAVRALARVPGVRVTGEVPDVASWLCRAEVAVDPLRMGAGMQNKLVQFMGCALPVVATTVANEGIGARPDHELIIRDDAEDFAEAVVKLLEDPAKRTRLGSEARRFVEANWRWETLFDRLRETFLEVSAEGRRSSRSVS